jgi:hypothetical protein
LGSAISSRSGTKRRLLYLDPSEPLDQSFERLVDEEAIER